MEMPDAAAAAHVPGGKERRICYSSDLSAGCSAIGTETRAEKWRVFSKQAVTADDDLGADGLQAEKLQFRHC